MKPRISEIDLHRSVADFLNLMLLPPAVWTTFPAGWTPMRSGAAGRLKGCGLRAGMPDILVFHNGFTVGLELKAANGTLSRPQQDMFAKLRNAGVLVHICRSIEDVYKALSVCHHIPMRKFNAPRIATPEGRRTKESTQGASSAA
ncbi:MAG TPA: VRR-NUC domain-containing protein [Candidatus Acidoferrum sp.]